MKEQNCSILSPQGAIISCSVNGYYPSVNIEFTHISITIVAMNVEERENSDLTLNKTVTITAVPSADPYICLASQIPEFHGVEESAMVYVTAPLPERTTRNPGEGVSEEPAANKPGYAVSKYA